MLENYRGTLRVDITECRVCILNPSHTIGECMGPLFDATTIWDNYAATPTCRPDHPAPAMWSNVES